MRLSFGLNDNNVLRAMAYFIFIIALVAMQYEDLHRLERSQKSVFLLRMPNATLANAHLYCDIPYNDCRCSITPVKYCLTDFLVKHIRIMTLLLFVSQIYLIRELLSLSTDYTLSLVYASWTTCLFVFISILVVMYRYTCFYNYIGWTLCFTGYLLIGFVASEVARENYHTRSPHYNNNMVND